MGLTTASICTALSASHGRAFSPVKTQQINVFIEIMNDKYLHINYLYYP